MDTQVIEFNAAEKTRGNWFFHCHILYHMMSGMGRILRMRILPPILSFPTPCRHFSMFTKWTENGT